MEVDVVPGDPGGDTGGDPPAEPPPGGPPAGGAGQALCGIAEQTAIVTSSNWQARYEPLFAKAFKFATVMKYYENRTITYPAIAIKQ